MWITHREKAGGPDDYLGVIYKGEVNHIEDDGTNGDFLSTLTDGSHVYVVTLAIGCVVLQVFGHTLPIQVGASVSPSSPGVQITPVRRPFVWPNGRGVDSIGGLIAFHQIFNR